MTKSYIGRGNTDHDEELCWSFIVLYLCFRLRESDTEDAGCRSEAQNKHRTDQAAPLDGKHADTRGPHTASP